MINNQHSVAAHWAGDFDEPALRQWAEQLRGRLDNKPVTLGLVFASPKFFTNAAELLETLQVHARIPLLVGCSSAGLIAGDQEIEKDPGLVLGLYSLPGAELKAARFTQEQLEECTGPGYWHLETGVTAEQTNGWLAFADPFHLDCEAWLRTWNEAYSPLPVVGGLASGDFREQRTQVYLNGKVFEEGGIAISFAGTIGLSSVISQGCTPIGETWTITKADQNIIYEIGNRPAYQVLVETVQKLPPDEQKKCQGNLFVGLVMNEYLDEFHRGDFLIRNLVGGDPNSGALAVAALPRSGQTIQFQRRDAAAGTEDITHLLQRAHSKLQKRAVYGACLCSCNGRGHRLFGKPGHDASHVQQQFGPLGLAGFFCNGEIGPVGDKNFLHGYTASLALFVDKTA
ncbi:MAG TPA: FIST N-terminal domain-containing protein [Candidatus Binatia bacterium]|nr:FIST N-terminal domain-containing protein [Candidatus Binatia bacterium]